MKVLRIRDLVERLGISRSSIYDKMNPSSSRYDDSFPKSILIGVKARGWLEEEIDQWLMAKLEVRK